MPIHHEWYNDEHTIVYIKPGPAFTTEEFITVAQHANGMIASVNHPVDLLVDHSDVRKIPTGLLSTARSQMRRLGARHIVQVGGPPLMRALRKYLVQVPGLKDRMPHAAETMEEALVLLSTLQAEEKG